MLLSSELGDGPIDSSGASQLGGSSKRTGPQSVGFANCSFWALSRLANGSNKLQRSSGPLSPSRFLKNMVKSTGHSESSSPERRVARETVSISLLSRAQPQIEPQTGLDGRRPEVGSNWPASRWAICATRNPLLALAATSRGPMGEIEIPFPQDRNLAPTGY